MRGEITRHRKVRNMRRPIVVNGKELTVLHATDRNLARKLLNCYEYYVWDGMMQLVPYVLKDNYPSYHDVVLYSEYFTIIDEDCNAGITYEQYEDAIHGLLQKKYLRLVDDIYECYERPYSKH